MKAKSVLYCFVVFLFSVLVFGQAKQDLCGTWKQNMEKSQSKSSLKGYVNKIDIQGDKLTVTTTTVGDRGERSYDRTYSLGEKEQKKGGDGDEFTTLAKIEGRNLIFDTAEKEGDRVLKTHEVWTVSEDGKTMTKVRKLSGGPRGESEQQYFFEKQ